MSRLSIAFVVVVAACGGANTGGGGSSVCTDPNAPASCGQACDATPGAANTCGAGAYCAEDGTCDSQCSTDQQCGEGLFCTSDGRCQSTNSGGDDDPGPDAPGCPAVNFTPTPVTPSIFLVLDGSKSMDGTDIAPNRYDAMRAALTGATGVVTSLQSKAYIGAGVYECGSGSTVLKNPVARARDNATTIDTYLGGIAPSGLTPTPQALTEAKNTFTTTPPPAGSPPVIVLATDGEPNSCANKNHDGKAESVAAATAAYAAGIPVYVLAINTGASTHFQDLANAGQGHQTGQPDVPYFPVASASDLQSAFQTIINGVISCDLTLTSSIDASQAGQGTVIVNGMNLTFGTDWTLVNGNTIHLEGQACTMLKGSANPTVNAQFPCGAVIF